MFLLIALTSLIGLLAYYFLQPLVKPNEITMVSREARDGESAVFRRSKMIGKDLPTTLTNQMGNGEPLSTLYDIFEYAGVLHKDLKCLGVRSLVQMHEEDVVVDGKTRKFTFPELGPYEWKTYGEVYNEIHDCAAGLVSIGMDPGDFLAIFEDTCSEWTVTSRAAFTQSITIFTVYANLGVDALEYALNQGDIKYIVANKDLVNILVGLKEKVPTLEWVISNGSPEKSVIESAKSVGLQVITYKDLVLRGKESPVEDVPPTPEDLALIMYTSGSTGVPKGVMTSHRNIMSAIAGIQAEVLTATPGDRLLHYLPLAHSMANMLESFAFYEGLSLHYGSPRTLSAAGVRNCSGDLKECEPNIFIAVPTIFEKVKHAVVGIVGTKGPVSKAMFNLALNQKLKAMKTGKSGAIWDKLVFNKTRETLGIQHLKYMITGSAPLSGEMQDFSRALFGAPLLQGYGLTETCSGGTIQDLNDFTNFKIGFPLLSTEIKLVDVPDMEYLSTDKPNPRGEIWIRGPNVTQGYFKNEEKTAEDFILEPDSPYCWFATGDIGEWCEEGVLKIIDRKKNLIKASHGEYIALEKLESAYRNCSWLDTLIVYVDSLRYHCIVLGVPNRSRLIAWANENGIDATDFGSLCQEPAVNALVLKSLKDIARARKLRSIEVVRAVYLDSEEWTPQNQMLTAAMKLNRHYIVRNYHEEIEQTYQSINE